MAAATLLLDLDGTIWDSHALYAATIVRLSGIGVPEIEIKLAGGANVIRLAGDYGVSRARLVRAIGGNNIPIVLYEGVRETLDRLQQRSTLMAVVSNLSGSLVMPMLQATGLERYFSAIITPRRGVPAKPQPHGIRTALDTLGRKTDTDTWYVGDGATDAAAAQAASVQFAWASYGYEPQTPPGTTAVIERFEDVLQL